MRRRGEHSLIREGEGWKRGARGGGGGGGGKVAARVPLMCGKKAVESYMSARGGEVGGLTPLLKAKV